MASVKGAGQHAPPASPPLLQMAAKPVPHDLVRAPVVVTRGSQNGADGAARRNATRD